MSTEVALPLSQSTLPPRYAQVAEKAMRATERSNFLAIAGGVGSLFWKYVVPLPVLSLSFSLVGVAACTVSAGFVAKAAKNIQETTGLDRKRLEETCAEKVKALVYPVLFTAANVVAQPIWIMASTTPALCLGVYRLMKSG